MKCRSDRIKAERWKFYEGLGLDRCLDNKFTTEIIYVYFDAAFR